MQKSTALILISLFHWSCTKRTVVEDNDRSDDGSFSTTNNPGHDAGEDERNDDTGSTESGTGEGGGEDSDGGGNDGGMDESGSEDSGTDDGGEEGGTDGGDEFPLDGIGEITGDCNVLSLPEDSGLWIHNTLNFGSEVFDEARLSHGGYELFEAGTLGGSSIHSEVMAFEVLHRCEIAFLVMTESEIEYRDDGGKKTDMLVEIDGLNVGVSVTRAYKWGDDAVFNEEDAYNLLSRKLEDVLLSGSNASESNPWSHAILSVVTYDPSYIPSLEAAYATLPAALTNETIVVITVTDGDDDFIY